MRSRLILRPNVTILVHDAASGRLVRTVRAHNLIVDSGLQHLIDLANGDSLATFTYGAVGTSNLSVLASDVALGNEVFRLALTGSTRTGVVWTLTLFLSSVQGNGHTITEFGEFTTPDSGGIMLARIVHAPIIKTASLTITYLHTITAAAS